jgi:hypothetical protein
MPTAILAGVSAPVAIDGSLPPSNNGSIYQGATLLGAYTTPATSGTLTDINGQVWTTTAAVVGSVITGMSVNAPAYYTGQSGFTYRASLLVAPGVYYSASFRVVAVGGNSVMMF